MQVARSVADLGAAVALWREKGERIAVAPTMGALHDGHLSLVRRAREVADRVIVTLFVNPTQFNRADDLERYPRTEEQDRRLLEPLGVDLLFAPPVSEIYPEGFATKISVSGVSEGLCGAHRPGHFDGVATVVAKLLLMTGAHKAVFGEKDWQQLQVIRRLVKDLNLPVEILGCPTIREADGLAMSSRNLLLSPAQRAVAPNLRRAMEEAVSSLKAGAAQGEVLSRAAERLLQAGFDKVEYLELRDAEALTPASPLSERPKRLLAAVWLGAVRLIDNIAA